MFNYTALSLTQTPPLAVPLRFFLSAPLFLLGAGLLLLAGDSAELASRWQPLMVGITHLVTLGFLALVMVGALQQLIPVLFGVSLPHSAYLAVLLYLLLVPGSALLALGIAWSNPHWVRGAMGLLGGGFVLFMTTVVWGVLRARSAHATVRSVAAAVLALLVTVTLGLGLAGMYGGLAGLGRQWTVLHLGWGLLGWVLLLVMAVGWQVVPMFQVTPPYPRRLQQWLPALLLAALLVRTLAYLVELALPIYLADVVILLVVALFAGATLNLQRQRRRRLPDVTLSYWRVAMLALLASTVLWVVLWFRPSALGEAGRGELVLGVLWLLGFAVSVVSGMLYKIVPFLIWLHLNNRLQQDGRWQGAVPNMRQVIPERRTRWNYRLHLLSVTALLALPFQPGLHAVAGGLLAANALLLWGNLLAAALLYRRHLRLPEQRAGEG